MNNGFDDLDWEYREDVALHYQNQGADAMAAAMIKLIDTEKDIGGQMSGALCREAQNKVRALKMSSVMSHCQHTWIDMELCTKCASVRTTPTNEKKATND